jgi:hypothetical protein
MVVVIGGGYFGSYHARQLSRAVAAGRLAGPIAIVDRDPACPAFSELNGLAFVEPVIEEWSSFLRRWLPAASGEDHLVPAPHAPHLLWSWLGHELGASPAAPPRGWGLPYEVTGPEGAVFVSAAAWRCPATCVEPAHCPALHAPRDWDLADLIETEAAARGYRPAVFRCLHLAAGVGSLRAAEILAARERMGRGSAEPVLVATSSRRHAALGALRVHRPPLRVNYRGPKGRSSTGRASVSKTEG